MVELTTAFATLSLFLLYRMYVISRKLYFTEATLSGIIDGRITITHTKDGVEMELKNND